MTGSVDMVPRRRRKRIRRIHNNGDSNSNSNSASKLFMSMVTDHVLWEILVRLPHAKHVIRCSLVSKRWQSLIHHSQFMAEFFRQNPRRSEGKNFELIFRIGDYGSQSRGPMYLHRLYGGKESETRKLYPNLGSDIKLHSSSLDLMLFKNSDKSEFYVYNPLISESLKIPAPIPYMKGSGVGIVTDLENFGHYKVLVEDDDAFDTDDDMHTRDVHVFCSRTRVWTRSRLSAPYTQLNLSEVVHNAISSQGVLYFSIAEDDSIIGNWFVLCSNPAGFVWFEGLSKGLMSKGGLTLQDYSSE